MQSPGPKQISGPRGAVGNEALLQSFLVQSFLKDVEFGLYRYEPLNEDNLLTSTTFMSYPSRSAQLEG